MDQRVSGFDVRIIGLFKRDSMVPLFCVFCCRGQIPPATLATILEHSDNFGFPYITTDVMCPMPEHCQARQVILVAEQNTTDGEHTWLPIRNIATKENEGKMLKYNFTVCISTLFDNYNNVLQFTQTLEIYR